MLSPYHQDFEDDFDLGLDFDQFEYRRLSRHRHQDHYDDFEPDPYGRYDDRDEHYGGGYYDSEPPYSAEYDENIVMKTRPEFKEVPSRHFEPREYYGGERYDDADRRSSRYSRQPRAQYHEPRDHYDRGFDDRDYEAYSRSGHHGAHGSRDGDYEAYSRSGRHSSHGSRDGHERHGSRGYDDYHHSSRYGDQNSRAVEESRRRTSRYEASREAPRAGSSGRSKSRSRKKEKIRNFPAPDSKLPSIPTPDYDGADEGVKYVPQPDY